MDALHSEIWQGKLLMGSILDHALVSGLKPGKAVDDQDDPVTHWRHGFLKIYFKICSYLLAMYIKL